MRTLNPYKIHWAIYTTNDNEIDLSKSIHAVNKSDLLNRISTKKGKYFIITDKQFGLIQNKWNNEQFTKNTSLPIHFEVKNKGGHRSLIPMTRQQFENPIINA
ncbi:MAG: hypothetical protein KDD03_06095 [Gelidibacter sp.]|nr:hypothetical protein [Gelidibacter sp.]